MFQAQNIWVAFLCVTVFLASSKDLYAVLLCTAAAAQTSNYKKCDRREEDNTDSNGRFMVQDWLCPLYLRLYFFELSNVAKTSLYVCKHLLNIPLWNVRPCSQFLGVDSPCVCVKLWQCPFSAFLWKLCNA